MMLSSMADIFHNVGGFCAERERAADHVVVEREHDGALERRPR